MPGSVQCGLNLATLCIIVDTPESMTCQVAQEVQMGALRNGTSLRIELRVEEETDSESLGSFTEDVRAVQGQSTRKDPSHYFNLNLTQGGRKHAPGEPALLERCLPFRSTPFW